MPVGSMPPGVLTGTLLMLVGIALGVIMVFERHTPGEGWMRVTSFYALVGAALIIVGAALAFSSTL